MEAGASCAPASRDEDDGRADRRVIALGCEPTLDGSEPRAHDDDELVTELRALLYRVDPMPAAVLVAAYDAFGGDP